MPLSLSQLKSAWRKKSKRRGRGHGSGLGTYAGRGLKGQRSRSGGRKNLKRKGLKSFLQQIPKKRGFKSFYPTKEIVNINDLNKQFSDGEVITLDKLLDKGLIFSKKNPVKILGAGKINKKLNIQANSFSKSAADAIKKAGGEVRLIK